MESRLIRTAVVFFWLTTLESKAKASSDNERLKDTIESTTNKESADPAPDSIHESGSVESKADIGKDSFESKSTSGTIEEAQPQIESGASEITVIVTDSECSSAAQ